MQSAVDPTVKFQQLKSMMQIVSTSSNPDQMLAYMAQSNPELKQLLNSIGSKNPKELFYNEARRKGLTNEQIDAFLKELAK